MSYPRLTSIALSVGIALLAHATANAANPCPNYQRNTGVKDCLYKRDVDDAAADIVWGNRATPKRDREVITIDPPWQRLGPADRPVEVLHFYRYHDWRRDSGRGVRQDWKRNADDVVAWWRASLPATVNVIRVPVAYRSDGKEDAFWAPLERLQLKMVLVGRALGIEDEVDRSIVAALDRNSEAFTSIPKIKAHFETALKVDGDTFDKVWTSSAVARHMTRSMDAYHHIIATTVRREGRRLVNPQQLPPVLLINGKHIVASFNVKRQRNTFQLANEFIAQELAGKTRRTTAGGRWRALYDELREVRVHDIAYTSTLKPGPGQIVEIDPPLKTASGRKRIEIEWFFAYLHRGYDPRKTTSWLTGRMENLINPWAETVPEEDFKRLRARFTVVSQIPGHTGAPQKQARMLQELALGWAYSEDVEPGERRPSHISFPIHSAIQNHLAYYKDPETLDSRREVNKMLRAAKIRMASYRLTRADGWPKRRADASTARFNKLVERAKKVAPGALRAPAYPIILIDGRYLITGALAGGYTAAARITNYTIQDLLKKRRR